MIKLKQGYDGPFPSEGARVMVDRLWPRGLTEELARVDDRQRELVPSTELRMWYGADRTRFARFRERYRMELSRYREEFATFATQGERRRVTWLYAARDSRCSNAAVLKELLNEELGRGRPRRTPLRRTSTLAGRLAPKPAGSR
jgi:uncharacterized protein YeaO (DUF488 family)